jgi:hypothetical protein
MRRKLKALALALAAVFAMSAIAAGSAAAAVEHEFHSEVEPTVVKGAGGSQEFTAGGVELTCPEVKFEGTVATRTTDEITVGIDYVGTGANGHCNGGGNTTNVRVADAGCHYRLDSDTTSGNPTNGEHANVALICDSGGITLEDTNTGLKLEVFNQTIEHAVHYDNEGSGSTRDVKVTATAHGIEWVCENSAFFCSLAVGGTSGSDGTYKGDVTAKGFEDLSPAKDTGPYEIGEQVGIWVE